MKKKNLKPMIISALLAVGFGATSVGTSFALFTDHADTTINVTAGKVDVSTALTVEAVSSLNSGDTGNVVADNKLSATLSQGGAVTVNANGTVSIDRMIPGDRVVLKMANTNASNVAIKHRVTTSSASFVFDGNTKVADTSNYKLGEKLTVKFYTDADCAEAHLVAKPDKWSDPVNPSADPISTYYIEVAFPDGDDREIKFGNENKDNIYQNKAADFAFSLEAVQGNADTTQATVINVATTEELQNALDSINSEVGCDPTIINLAAGAYGDIKLYQSAASTVKTASAHNNMLPISYEFDYRYRRIENLTINGGENVTVRSLKTGSGQFALASQHYTTDGITQDPGNSQMYCYDGLDIDGLTINNIKFVGEGIYSQHQTNVFAWSEHLAGTQTGGTIKNLTINNCEFDVDENTTTNGGIRLTEGNNTNQNNDTTSMIPIENVTIKNTKFGNVYETASVDSRKSCFYVGLIKNLDMENCIVDSNCYNFVQVQTLADGDFIIKNNQLKKTASRYIRLVNLSDNFNANVSGNDFYNKGAGFVMDKYIKVNDSKKLTVGANRWQNEFPSDVESTNVNINVQEQTIF